jgi:hypothetical protein
MTQPASTPEPSAQAPVQPPEAPPSAPIFDDAPNDDAAVIQISSPRDRARRVTGLRVLNGPWANMLLDLPASGEEVLLGRNDPPSVTVDIDLTEAEISNPPLVSRRHAIIYRDRATGSMVIQDIGSTNGTWVEGGRCRPGAPARPILVDSVIRLANIKFVAVAGTEIE